MACAFTGPISGSASSSSFVAVLMLIFVPGASFEAEEEGEDFLEGEEGEDAAGALPVAAELSAVLPAAAPPALAPPPAAAPAPEAAALPSPPFEELFFFVPFSEGAGSSFAAAAPTPSESFRTLFRESSFLPEPTPLTLETSSHVLYGRFLTSSLASFSPTPFAAAIVFSSAVFRLTFSVFAAFPSVALAALDSPAGVGVFFLAATAAGDATR